jgi:hypothetical protein
LVWKNVESGLLTLTNCAAGVSERAGFGYFDTFSQSLGTLFQVASGDSWIMTVVRPLSQVLRETAGPDEDNYAWSVWPFFISYYILSSVVLFNVIVAILLGMHAKRAQKIL